MIKEWFRKLMAEEFGEQGQSKTVSLDTKALYDIIEYRPNSASFSLDDGTKIKVANSYTFRHTYRNNNQGRVTLAAPQEIIADILSGGDGGLYVVGADVVVDTASFEEEKHVLDTDGKYWIITTTTKMTPRGKRNLKVVDRNNAASQYNGIEIWEKEISAKVAEYIPKDTNDENRMLVYKEIADLANSVIAASGTCTEILQHSDNICVSFELPASACKNAFVTYKIRTENASDTDELPKREKGTSIMLDNHDGIGGYYGNHFRVGKLRVLYSHERKNAITHYAFFEE